MVHVSLDFNKKVMWKYIAFIGEIENQSTMWRGFEQKLYWIIDSIANGFNFFFQKKWEVDA